MCVNVSGKKNIYNNDDRPTFNESSCQDLIDGLTLPQLDDGEM